MNKLLVIPDIHAPFHDHKAWSLVLKIVKEWQPDGIVQLGDSVDCYAISAHDKDPQRSRGLKWETDVANGEIFDALDEKAPKAKKWITFGNHEYRLNRMLWQTPGLNGVTAMEDLLHLKKRGWKWRQYKTSLQINHFHFTHDVDGRCGNGAHMAARNSFEACTVIGHTHRLHVGYSSNIRGKAKVGAMLGWLGAYEGIDYRHQATAKRDWQHGVGLIRFEKSGLGSLQAVPFVEGKCNVEGVWL